MNSRTGRLLAVSVGVVVGLVAYAVHPNPASAGFAGLFWCVTGLLARRNWWVVRRRGSRWAGAYGGLTALAASASVTLVAPPSLPDGFGFALGLFVLGVANAMVGVGVELAAERAADRGDGAASRASAAPDGGETAAGTTGR